MLASDVPAKFPIPWANNAGSTTVRAIPEASQQNTQPGAASLTDGFTPLNLTPIQAGGIPPFGQDMNGILRQITQWVRWLSAGGALTYDGAFAAKIGGYPAGARVMSNARHAVYENLVDGNSTDPNGTGTNWVVADCVWGAKIWPATGSANAQVVALAPTPTVALLQGIPILVTSVGTNSGNVTLNVGGIGALPVTMGGGTQLSPNTLWTGLPFMVVLIGNAWVLLSNTRSFIDVATGGVQVFAETGNSNGANLQLTGNGTTTPSKYLRVANGVFQIISNGYLQAILNLTDAGTLSITGAFSAAGTISSSNRVRAALGARGSGDNAAAAILSDWTLNGTAGTGNRIWIHPDGTIVQIQTGISVVGNDNVSYAVAFPSEVYGVFSMESNPAGWDTSPLTPTIVASINRDLAGHVIRTAKWIANSGQWSYQGGVGYRTLAIGR
jgi:hypothetical protein